MFLTPSVAKYGSVVGGLSSAIVPEGLKGKGTSVHVHSRWTTVYGVQWEGGLLIGENKTNLHTIPLCVPIHTHNMYFGNHFHSSVLSVWSVWKDKSEVCCSLQ